MTTPFCGGGAGAGTGDGDAVGATVEEEQANPQIVPSPIAIVHT